MNKMTVALVLVAGLAFHPAFAAGEAAKGQSVGQVTSADILQEVGATQREIEEAMAPIRSAADLKRYLETTTDSPLDKLGASARGNFLKSLVFAKGGLGSYSYVELSGLTVTDAYRILSLFGAQSSVSSIPNLKPRNKSEESVYTLSSRLYGTQGVIRNYECIVYGADPDPTRCSYMYGRNCNSLCK